MKRCFGSVFLVGALVAGVVAQQPSAGDGAKTTEMSDVTLKIGDKAPPLKIEKWVKGAPVTAYEPGMIYVIEHWATWCGPCIAQMPHLTALQKEHKGKVTVVGVTSQDSRGNTLDKVEAMVKEKGDETMGYTVAWDSERATSEAFMKAAGRNGIPCSFVIDGKGTIAWIGHPMWLDAVIDPLLAGTWDAKTGPERIANGEKALSSAFAKAASDPKEAIAAWQAFEKEFPKVAREMGDTKLRLFMRLGEYDAAYKAAAEIVDGAIAKKDATKLNEIAWMIVDPHGSVTRKDLDLAMKAATKADEFTKGEDAAIIDTLARVYFLKGNVERAIELQTKAVSLAKDERLLDELRPALEEYKQAAKKND